MYNLKRGQKSILPLRTSGSQSRPFKEINHFPGHYMQETSNILNLPLGSLIDNRNCEYGIHDKYVYTKTRRGSTMICDTTNGESGYGIAEYLGVQYLFWIDAVTGELNYTLDEVGSVYNTGAIFNLGTDSDMFFYNHPITPALYICNTTDGVWKVSFAAGPTLTVTAVAGSPKIARMAFSHISGRLFGIDNAHTFYYTKIQQTTAIDTSSIEDWAVATQFAIVSPDQGDGFRAIIDDGNNTFFFKDTGVWCLPNANEATADWIVPKLKIDTGCSAPLTVMNVRYKQQNGIAFLANDNTIRFFSGYTQRNAGTIPTFMENESIVLSHEYQFKLDSIDRSVFKLSSSGFYDQIYMLCYCSNGGSAIDAMVCIDFEKGKEYWFDYENYTCSHFSRTKDHLYGFDTRGFILSMFVNNKLYDEFPNRIVMYTNDVADDNKAAINRVAIRWSFYTSWFKISDYLQRLMSGYVNFYTTGAFPINIRFNSFTKGDIIPAYDSGFSAQLKSRVSNASYWDSAVWDISLFTGNVNSQTNSGSFSNGEGNYFNFGFYSDTIYQAVTVYSMQFNFKQLRSTPNVSN